MSFVKICHINLIFIFCLTLLERKIQNGGRKMSDQSLSSMFHEAASRMKDGARVAAAKAKEIAKDAPSLREVSKSLVTDPTFETSLDRATRLMAEAQKGVRHSIKHRNAINSELTTRVFPPLTILPLKSMFMYPALLDAVSLTPSDMKRRERRENLSSAHKNLDALISMIQDIKQPAHGEASTRLAAAANEVAPHPAVRAAPAATVHEGHHDCGDYDAPTPPATIPLHSSPAAAFPYQSEADLLGGTWGASGGSGPASAEPSIDLLGSPTTHKSVTSARVPVPHAGGTFADFGATNVGHDPFSSSRSSPMPSSLAPAPAVPGTSASEGDLLGGFTDFDASPVAPSTSNGSFSSGGDFGDLFGEAGTQPSINDLLNGMSAADELNMATPLMPEGATGGSVEERRRLKLPGAMLENAPPEPEEKQSDIEKRVGMWQEGKNLQAMLATLHEIAPKCCRWEPRTLGQLLDEAMLKDAYKLALVAVHPDKLGDRPDWERARCQLIFNALRRNRPRSNTAAV